MSPTRKERELESEPAPSRRKRTLSALPRVAQLTKKTTSEEPAGEDSPRLEWDQQRRLLDRLEKEQKRKEEKEWRAELARMKAEDEGQERAELQERHRLELMGLQNTARQDADAPRVPANRRPRTAPEDRHKIPDSHVDSFIMRMQADAEGRREKIAIKQKLAKEKEVKVLKHKPEISARSARMVKPHRAGMSSQARLERLSSPVRERRSPQATAVAAAKALEVAPPRRTTTQQQQEFLARAEADSRRRHDRLRHLAANEHSAVNKCTFRPAINRCGGA